MDHADSQGKTIFEKIIAGSVPADFVYEDDQVVAIKDINPKAPVHLLILPKKHFPSLKEVDEGYQSLMGHMIMIAKKLAEERNLEGYRLQFNVGPKGGQVVFHLHLHLLGWN